MTVRDLTIMIGSKTEVGNEVSVTFLAKNEVRCLEPSEGRKIIAG